MSDRISEKEKNIALVHFIFSKVLPVEEQDEILAHMNHEDYWGGVEHGQGPQASIRSGLDR